MSSLTIPPNLSSPRQDAADLYKAFKGFGCDSSKIVNILAHRDATQRGLIQQEYRISYSEELTTRLSKELGGDLKKAMILWIPDPATRDAMLVRQALMGDSLDLYAASEVLCSRTPTQIQTIKQIYFARYRTYLEHDIKHLTSGDHEKLLLAYIGTVRYEGPEVDPMMAAEDAKELYRAGEKRIGTDEKMFIRIFSERSRAHLAAVALSYHQAYGKFLEQSVKGETSGLFEFTLLTILRCAENPAAYFAKALYKSMVGIGTNDTKLIRIVVSRTEIDMEYIKTEYQRLYHKKLSDAIHSETSGHYRTFLLELVGHSH